ncbi:hypothetical protein AUQ48_11730 [Kocuria flava]|uniref:Peptidase S8/S53 domain-containing protein n=1 Tax=Kocuria flava TaxID=446860 RepID=A0A2N4T3H0_9MICC|nr:S8 family serine peptidase [Kocuria flava]PLC12767.1 hypothetical protein AUQ48_11730 [Kocuria flava]
MRTHRLLPLLTCLSLLLAPAAPAAATDPAPPAGSTSSAESAAPRPASAAPQVTDRLVVRFTPEASAAERRRALGEAAAVTGLAGAASAAVVAGDAAQVLELPEAVPVGEVAELAAELTGSPAVESAAPDRLLAGQWRPDDLDPGAQWAAGALGLPRAWDAATGAGTVIGVVDSGLAAHSDVSPKAIGGYDFVSSLSLANDGDPRDGRWADPGSHAAAGQCWVDPATGAGNAAAGSTWHGTHVAGVAAAVTGNGRGIAGVAPGARLLVARAIGACDLGYTSDVADAIRWLAGGPVAGAPAPPRAADVISISLGALSTCDPVLQSAVDEAVGRGVPVVVAAGNDGLDASASMPANCRGVIAVGAVDQRHEPAWFSNHGPTVDVWAPGTAIRSTLDAGRTAPAGESYGELSGTSQAAPHVAGLVALLEQQDPAATPAQLEARLRATAAGSVPVADAAAALGLAPAVEPDFPVAGAIGRYWLSARPALGQPLGEEAPVPGGARQEFERGTVHWSPATGARTTRGAVRAAHRGAAGGPAPLGFPTTEERADGTGGVVQSFQHGRVVWSPPTGARILRGAIGAAWARTGHQAGVLGYPVGAERPNGLGGAYQVFQRGKLLWSPATGAQVLRGAVAARYAELGDEHGALGYPRSGERPDGAGGVAQRFEHGRILWSAATGAHPVQGAIAARHARLGGEHGVLGRPVTGEQRAAGGTVQTFEGGTITWTAGAGTRVRLS